MGLKWSYSFKTSHYRVEFDKNVDSDAITHGDQGNPNTLTCIPPSKRAFCQTYVQQHIKMPPSFTSLNFGQTFAAITSADPDLPVALRKMNCLSCSAPPISSYNV